MITVTRSPIPAAQRDDTICDGCTALAVHVIVITTARTREAPSAVAPGATRRTTTKHETFIRVCENCRTDLTREIIENG